LYQKNLNTNNKQFIKEIDDVFMENYE